MMPTRAGACAGTRHCPLWFDDACPPRRRLLPEPASAASLIYVLSRRFATRRRLPGRRLPRDPEERAYAPVNCCMHIKIKHFSGTRG